MSPPHDLLPAEAVIDLSTCDREPIHTPGCIQPHGALLVADARTMRIACISANLPASLLGQSLVDVLGAGSAERVEAALRQTGHSLSRVCAGTLPTPDQPPRDLVAHRMGEQIFIEFEPAAHAGNEAELLAQAQNIIQAMRRTRNRQELCDLAVRELKRLTGFDRVMCYRFDGEANGEVIAEAREPELEAFQGLRYPASDIPRQARHLYLQQRVRSIVDVGTAPVPLLAGPDRSPAALDMTYCHLRSISPLHIEYLQNMGVGATLAISLVPDSNLWGMLICHHRTSRHTPAHVRALCDLIGQLMSLLIGVKGQNELLSQRLTRLEMLDALNERTMTMPSVAEALLHQPHDLLSLLRADGVLLHMSGQSHLVGQTPDLPAALAVATALRATCAGDVAATESLATIDSGFASFREVASGALAMPILHGPDDTIVWFRQELTRTVTWGGARDKPMTTENGRLTPRKSFAAWQEEVRGCCDPWELVDHEIARDLRRLITSAALRHMEIQASLANLRHYDALTNLPNRRMLEERLAARVGNPGAPPAAMIFLDLDRFKTVNDSLGHAVGDQLLVQVANRLIETVPAECLAARLGGDEFVVLCENSTPQQAQSVADDVVAAFRAPFELAGRPYRLTTSVGVASARSGQPDDLLRAADSAMYAAKRSGGDRAVSFDNRLHEAVSMKLELEQDLYQALERGEFELHYQPLARIADCAIFGFEALLRWRHPVRGLVSPAEFVPTAEETGLIVPIGSWVLQQALQHVRDWRERYGCPVIVSVNVSAPQIKRPDFPAQIAEALATAGQPPSALLLEVTESILTQDAAIAHLRAVRQTGVHIAIDDFGTGYSSLAYLHKLPVDELKIDKLFVDRIEVDSRQASFMRALIQLAHTLSLSVIAEGVEKAAQWEELRVLGCDMAQGYWISRPVTAEGVEKILRQGTPLRTVPLRVRASQAGEAEPRAENPRQEERRDTDVLVAVNSQLAGQSRS